MAGSGATEVAPSSGSLHPRTALERVLVPALERPPCVVSFSGGRDSSAVLAVAARVARARGLNLPIPITIRFSGVPEAGESVWQRLAVDHLRLNEWKRIDLDPDDCDWIGPLAAPGLRRYGLLAGSGSFLTRRIAAEAEGGSLLTGHGGDQMFYTWRWRRLADVLARRARPRPHDALRLAYAALPPAGRQQRERRRISRQPLPWLRPAAARKIAALQAQEAAGEPVWWSNRVRWRMTLRDIAASRVALKTLTEDANVLASSPLTDARFVDALARHGGRFGYGDRTAAMVAIFRDLLPAELLQRRTKAAFAGVHWRGHSRRFAEQWDGTGVDRDLVDAEALRAEWLSPSPDARSSALLQAAWLHGEGESPPGAVVPNRT